MGQQDRETEIEELYREYAATPMLAELAHGRRMVPPGGPPDSPLMVMGEAPGAEEERRGRPFVGPSGALLRELFQAADLPWDYCYTANVVPWRPPGNRTPYPFEVQCSWDRIGRETALVEPEVIVAAGAVAWRGLTRDVLGRFDDARFKWHELAGRRLLALPHPAYLLRLGGTERQDWERTSADALRQAMQGAGA